MLRGKGNKGQSISGTAALLSNIRKKGGWNKVVQEIATQAGVAAALAATEKYQDISKLPEIDPTSPGKGNDKPTRH